MTIAILDDGINRREIHSPVDTYMVQNNKVVQTFDSCLSKKTHGTICAKIIELAHDDLHFVSIQVYSESYSYDTENIASALEWCINQKIHYVNVSCGYNSFFSNERINKICYQLWKKGVIVFCAYSNSGLYTIPACLPYTFGVSSISSINTTRCPDLRVEGGVRIDFQGSEYCTEDCNSFACANACRYAIEEAFTIKQIHNRNNVYLAQSSGLALYDFTQLQEPMIISKGSIYKELLPFTYHDNSFKDSDGFLILSKESIIPSIILELDCLLPNLYCIICCCHKIPDWLLQWCKKNHVRYWDESIVTYEEASQTLSSPIVEFKGPHRKTIAWAQKFINWLTIDNYNPLFTSSKHDGYLYGAVKIENVEKLCSCDSELMPDIIVLDSGNRPFDVHTDIQIVPQEENGCTIFANGKSYLFNDYDLNVYQFVINLMIDS